MNCSTCAHFSQTRYDDPETHDVPGYYEMTEEQAEAVVAAERGRWGTCERIDHGWGASDASDRAYTMDASGYASSLHCRSDFGCVEWAAVSLPVEEQQ